MDENIVSLLRKIPPFFFFSINILVHIEDQRKKNLKKDGINFSFSLSLSVEIQYFLLLFFKGKSEYYSLKLLGKIYNKTVF